MFQYTPKCVFCNYNFITGFMFVLWANNNNKKPKPHKNEKCFFMCIFIVSMLFDILNRAYGKAKCANYSATSFSVHYKTECIYTLCCAVLCYAFFGWFILILSPLLDCWSWKSIENKKNTGEQERRHRQFSRTSFLQFK